MPVNVVVQFQALAEKLPAFQTIMETVRVELPKTPGCQAVSVMQDADNPCRFTLVETWESQGRHKAHIESLVADGTWAHIASHLAAQPSSGYFHPL
nr:antibiotic biosynthesis monooxygenase [uncultured Devosia sp.]